MLYYILFLDIIGLYYTLLFYFWDKPIFLNIYCEAKPHNPLLKETELYKQITDYTMIKEKSLPMTKHPYLLYSKESTQAKSFGLIQSFILWQAKKYHG